MTAHPPSALPTITTSGTARVTLQSDYRQARHKLDEAIAALSHCAPHARDYPSILGEPIAHQRLANAQSDHLVRLNRLRDTLTELDIISEHLGR